MPRTYVPENSRTQNVQPHQEYAQPPPTKVPQVGSARSTPELPGTFTLEHPSGVRCHRQIHEQCEHDEDAIECAGKFRNSACNGVLHPPTHRPELRLPQFGGGSPHLEVLPPPGTPLEEGGAERGRWPVRGLLLAVHE